MSLRNGWEKHIKKKLKKKNTEIQNWGRETIREKNRLEGRDRDNEEQ